MTGKTGVCTHESVTVSSSWLQREASSHTLMETLRQDPVVTNVKVCAAVGEQDVLKTSARGLMGWKKWTAWSSPLSCVWLSVPPPHHRWPLTHACRHFRCRFKSRCPNYQSWTTVVSMCDRSGRCWDRVLVSPSAPSTMAGSQFSLVIAHAHDWEHSLRRMSEYLVCLDTWDQSCTTDSQQSHCAFLLSRRYFLFIVRAWLQGAGLDGTGLDVLFVFILWLHLARKTPNARWTSCNSLNHAEDHVFFTCASQTQRSLLDWAAGVLELERLCSCATELNVPRPVKLQQIMFAWEISRSLKVEVLNAPRSACWRLDNSPLLFGRGWK